MLRDTNWELCNLFLYFKKNKAKVAKQLLYYTKLRQINLGLTKKKTRDKINSVIAFCKIKRNKVDEIEWHLDGIYHNQIIKNTLKNSIWKVLI